MCGGEMKTKIIIGIMSFVLIILVYLFLGLVPLTTYLIGTLIGTFFGISLVEENKEKDE